MALPSSGPISFGNLRSEFGGSTPIRLSSYYRGGGLVPNTSDYSKIPTSGTISMSHFRGTGSGSGAFSASVSKSLLFGRWPRTTMGTLSDSVTITCSGGSGSYWIVSVSNTDEAVITGTSGLTVTASATARNTRIEGTLIIVVTDGSSQITLYVDYEFIFGSAL